MIFTKSECELVSGSPNKPSDQDSYDDLMRMEDSEIRFWVRVSKTPNNMEESEWIVIRDDYFERIRIAREEGIESEKLKLDNIIKRLEIKDINLYASTGELPTDVFDMTEISDDGMGMLLSKKWGVPIGTVYDVWKYEQQAIDRDKYYQLAECEKHENRYEQYLEYLMERKAMTGDTETIVPSIVIEPKNIETIIELFKEKAKTVVVTKPEVKKKKVSDDDVSDDDDDGVEDGDVSYDESIQLDDGIDDTQGNIPDNYIVFENIVEVKPESKDEWGF
jgi:hypothetical protein